MPRENVIAQFRLERIGTDTRRAGGTALRVGPHVPIKNCSDFLGSIADSAGVAMRRKPAKQSTKTGFLITILVPTCQMAAGRSSSSWAGKSITLDHNL